MTMFLCIENKGEIEAAAITLMGASSKRGDAGMIGQFGTGNKYAIAVLMKMGIVPTITSGETRIKFNTKRVSLRGKGFDQIIMQVGSKKYELSFTTEMGLHWGIPEAMREIVSNAQDENRGTVPSISIARAVTGAPGVTRWFIPYEPAVQDFQRNLDRWFTFTRQPLHKIGSGVNETRFYKPVGEGIRVYRRGVLVFSDEKMKCVFDYDFPSISVREDRTADNWSALCNIAHAVEHAPIEVKKAVFDAVRKFGKEYAEGQSSVEYYIGSHEDWKKIVQDKLVTTTETYKTVAKNLTPEQQDNVVVLPESWTKAMHSSNVGQKIEDLLDDRCLNGWVKEVDLIPAHQQMLDEVLAFLSRIGMEGPEIEVATNPKPDAHMGEYHGKDDRVIVNLRVFEKGKRELMNTIVHEWMHAKSGASDYCAAFQDALVNELIEVAARLTGEVI